MTCATSRAALTRRSKNQRCVHLTLHGSGCSAETHGQSEFLELLFKYNCIRTQKKQKVFYWFSVPHDRLFLDALDRDLKREKLGVEPTTEAVAEPALSFVYNPNKSLFEQFTEQQALQDAEASAGSSQQQSTDSEGSGDEARSHQRSASASRHRPSSLTRADSSHENGLANVSHEADGSQILLMPPGQGDYRSANLSAASSSDASLSCPSSGAVSTKPSRTFTDPQASAIFGAFALFEGSPTYKQRRKPGAKRTSPLGAAGGSRAQESSPGIASQSERSGSPMYGQDNDGSAGSRSRPTSSCGLGISHAPSHEGLPSQDTSSLYAMPAHGLPPGASSYGLASAPSYAMPGPGDPCAGLVVGQNSMSALELSAAAAAQAVLEEGPGGNKTFVCPLYSCGRLFKRQEHLVRHGLNLPSYDLLTSPHCLRNGTFGSTPRRSRTRATGATSASRGQTIWPHTSRSTTKSRHERARHAQQTSGPWTPTRIS